MAKAKSFLKKYSKVYKFQHESDEHAKLRLAAYKWLWNKGFRAFASFIEVNPYGLIDIIAIKENEVWLIDCETDSTVISNRSRDIDQLEKDQIQQIEELVRLFKDINLQEDISKNEDIQRNLTVLKNINMMLGDDNLYSRLVSGILIANHHWLFFPDYIKNVPKVKNWGHVRCGVSEKSRDYRPYITIQSERLEREDIITVKELESKMVRSLSHEMHCIIPDNIFLA